MLQCTPAAVLCSAIQLLTRLLVLYYIPLVHILNTTYIFKELPRQEILYCTTDVRIIKKSSYLALLSYTSFVHCRIAPLYTNLLYYPSFIPLLYQTRSTPCYIIPLSYLCRDKRAKLYYIVRLSFSRYIIPQLCFCHIVLYYTPHVLCINLLNYF